MKLRLINAVPIVVVLILFGLLSQTITNAIFTLIITTLSGISFYGCFCLWKVPLEPSSQPFPTLLSRISTALLLVAVALPLGYFSYWLFSYEPFVIICRYSNQCELGPYGWSVALLSLGVSLLLIIRGIRWF